MLFGSDSSVEDYFASASRPKARHDEVAATKDRSLRVSKSDFEITIRPDKDSISTHNGQKPLKRQCLVEWLVAGLGEKLLKGMPTDAREVSAKLCIDLTRLVTYTPVSIGARLDMERKGLAWPRSNRALPRLSLLIPVELSEKSVLQCYRLRLQGAR